MDNSKSAQQIRRMSLTPSSMARTLWSTESPTRDLRSNVDPTAVNVRVVLRCRPMNEDETRARTPVVVSCDELKREVIAIQNMANKQINKTYVFDKVFGPASEQKELYDDVVAPVVNEVLEGYSWTIFAYGQTGTGKTFTMEGEARKEKNGQFHKDAGVIPRAIHQIFDILETRKADYSMKVTFLELYNEEITDLLAPEEGSVLLDDKSKRPLVLMEDGKGAVFVRGLEEEIVSTADEIYAILDKGSAKKRVAETLLNKQSNRSHSMFMITVEIKESKSDGSEVITCGKLNLVDLAGSENIIRSGAKEERAREAGEINKSLLTLGRVINALADNSVHVPFRESKLTRLLRDSLGGKTKTCIIATISPSIFCIEETLSTLDYAFRAKSIKNRPEVNQKVMQSTLVKDLYAQIDCLEKELQKARAKNGIYAHQDNQHGEEATRKQLMELQKLYMYQQQLTVDLKDKLESTEIELTKTKQSLANMEDQYLRAKDDNKDKETVIFNILSSGKALTDRALELRSDLEGAASDVSTLLARIEHKNSLDDSNKHNIQNFHSQLAQQLEELNKSVSASLAHQEQNLTTIQIDTQSFLTSKAMAMDELRKQIQNQQDLYASGVKHLECSAEELYQNSQSALSRLSSELSAHSSGIMDLVKKSSSEAETKSNGLKTNLSNLGSSIDAFLKQQEENHVRTYQTSKSISQSLVNYFKSLRIYISKLTLLEEDSQIIINQKLSTFTQKFEEFELGEERLLLEQMAELLASSRSRKKKLIEAAVDDMIESASKRANKLNEEISNVQNLTADAEGKLTNYVNTTENKYTEDSAGLEAGKSALGEGLQCCVTKSTEVAERRRTSEESLLDLLQKNFDSVDSFIKNGKEDDEKFNTRFSTVASSVLKETDDARKNILSSVEYPLRLDHETSEKINSLSVRCLEDMKETNSIHSEKVVEISRIARKSLLDDYLVDSSSCLSPRKRDFNLLSKEYIESIINVSFGNSIESSQSDEVALDSDEHQKDLLFHSGGLQ